MPPLLPGCATIRSRWITISRGIRYVQLAPRSTAPTISMMARREPGQQHLPCERAFTYGVLSNRFEEAFELADRALIVHPNSVFVRNRAASVYVVCGEIDKAIAQCEAASRMNPLDSRRRRPSPSQPSRAHFT
jgi:hypothetical protein